MKLIISDSNISSLHSRSAQNPGRGRREGRRVQVAGRHLGRHEADPSAERSAADRRASECLRLTWEKRHDQLCYSKRNECHHNGWIEGKRQWVVHEFAQPRSSQLRPAIRRCPSQRSMLAYQRPIFRVQLAQQRHRARRPSRAAKSELWRPSLDKYSTIGGNTNGQTTR